MSYKMLQVLLSGISGHHCCCKIFRVSLLTFLLHIAGVRPSSWEAPHAALRRLDDWSLITIIRIWRLVRLVQLEMASLLQLWLVLWNMNGSWLSIHIGNFIIPTDFHSSYFSDGLVETTSQSFFSGEEKTEFLFVCFFPDNPGISDRKLETIGGPEN